MKIENEEQLQTIVEEKGFKYGDRFPTFAFVVSYVDTVTNALLSSNVFKTPVDGIAALPEVCKATKRSVDSVSIYLDFGFDYNSRRICDINVELDKYIYFSKPKEITNDDNDDIESEE